MTQQQLIDVLRELISEGMSITDETTYKKISTKYDVMFLGEHFNHIYSLDLRHTLEHHFGITVSNDELNDVLPSVCEHMGLECSPMYAVSDLSNSNRTPHCYQITLW